MKELCSESLRSDLDSQFQFVKGGTDLLLITASNPITNTPDNRDLVTLPKPYPEP